MERGKRKQRKEGERGGRGGGERETAGRWHEEASVRCFKGKMSLKWDEQELANLVLHGVVEPQQVLCRHPTASEQQEV